MHFLGLLTRQIKGFHLISDVVRQDTVFCAAKFMEPYKIETERVSTFLLESRHEMDKGSVISKVVLVSFNYREDTLIIFSMAHTA